MWKSLWFRSAAICLFFLVAAIAQDAPPQEVPHSPPPPLPTAQTAADRLPLVLRDWQMWVLWDLDRSPPTYQNVEKKIAVWPSTLALDATAAGATFSFSIRVFHESRVQLPGDAVHWPAAITANGQAVAVTPKNGRPSVQLAPGQWSISGSFVWAELPQQLAIPPEIGLLTLSVSGAVVPFPAWDTQGNLWLRRDRVSDEADKDFLSTQVYRVIEDGIPMWLRSEIELAVSGKNREEIIGGIIPAGWKVSSVDAPIPVFVDANGEMKAQVRPGRWTVTIDAFRLDSPAEIAYPEGLEPAVSDELVAFRAQPDLRVVEITGVPAVDISQTTFPEKWRDLPVYRWETENPIGLVERQRGTGFQQPAGLSISREMWLDENGGGITFRDRITGVRQEIWRLDAAAGQIPGSIQSGGDGQLITRNPATGAPGVEIRTRDLNVLATGRMDDVSDFSATGWQTDAEDLRATMMLPPGWRLLAIFGPDEVDGEWLSSWSLLDLFLLLIFTFAVSRLWGPAGGVLAFFAFVISYHEPNAPRFLWLALLPPLALLRVVSNGNGRTFIQIWKWATVLALAFVLIPFLSQQVQQLLYPQLERDQYGQLFTESAPTFASERGVAASAPLAEQELMVMEDASAVDSYSAPWSKSPRRRADESSKSNLAFAAGARIQTGPGVPNWSWRQIQMRWSGPVQQDQTVQPILISMQMERIITALRILLLLALAALLLNARRTTTLFGKYAKPAAVVAIVFVALAAGIPGAHAQIPDEALLQTLRERLITKSDAFPDAADIAETNLQLRGNQLTATSTIHAAVECAVPLPGRLPSWSPVRVTLNGQPATAIGRLDGFLWVVVPQGVHEVVVEGLLPESADWEWTFALRPRRITVDAPDWNVTGINADGVPESQVFLSRKEQAGAAGVDYDRQDLDAVAVVERNFELGLVWQVTTTVRRLSPRGRAIELRVPLIPGERVLSGNLLLDGNRAEVRLGGNEDSVTWSSELPVTESLVLSTSEDAAWVEQWKLVASPVWNLAFAGIDPIFEPSDPNLVPVWSPWPGESVTWTITRPEAERGATLTIDWVQNAISVGSRLRTNDLTLALRSSLGEEFAIILPEMAEVTGVTHDDKQVPVRIDNGRLVLPLKPGAQHLSIAWRINEDAGFDVRADAVQLPVEGANVRTNIQVGPDRWILWTYGPLRGPAVRFWIVLVVALAAGWILGSVPGSPLKHYQWMLLSLGLTQVPLAAAIVVAAWFFLLVWRGSESFSRLPGAAYNLVQLGIIASTGVVLLIFIWIVGAGLLGNPEMFILGNASTSTSLQWYQDRCGELISQPGYFSISIWWYRLLMLLWALWLAAALIKWLWWAWQKFTHGVVFKVAPRKIPSAPKQP